MKKPILLVLFVQIISTAIYEWHCFLSIFPKLIWSWPLIFTSILLHNLWMSFIIAFSFYFATEMAEMVYPEVRETNPIFKHPRISSLVLAVFLMASSVLKVPSFATQLPNPAILVAAAPIAVLEVYGAYCAIQMGLHKEASRRSILRVFLALLCGALIETIILTVNLS